MYYLITTQASEEALIQRGPKPNTDEISTEKHDAVMQRGFNQGKFWVVMCISPTLRAPSTKRELQLL